MRLFAVLSISLFLLLCRITHAEDFFTSCYLYASDVADVSFTYSYNEARLAAHAMLLEEVQQDLRSNAYSDFLLVSDPASQMATIIQQDHCQMVVATSPNMLGGLDLVAFARRFPSVFFFERVDSEPLETTTNFFPANYASFLTLSYQNLFAAGALAATQAASCVGVIYPFESQRWIPNAVQQGALWASSSTPIFSVALHAAANTADEIVITDLLLQRGCDVILSASLSTAVPQYIASLQRGADVMGIGYGQDASLTAGDAILTSVLEDMRHLFYNMTMEALNGTLTSHHINLWKATELLVGDPSPLAKPEVARLTTEVREYISSTLALCQPFFDQEGTRHTGCIDHTTLANYTFLDQRIHDMSMWQSPSTCRPGTYVDYETTTFELRCIPCAVNTFSTEWGATECTPCYNGLTSSAGSSMCRAPSEDGFPLLMVIPIVIGILFLIAVIGLILFALMRPSVEPTRDPNYAPRGPRVALAMIGVDGSRSDRQWRSSLGNMCEVYDRLAAVVTPVANKHRAYTFVSVGDVVMLAAPSTQTLFDVLVDIHRSAWTVAWPCTIHLKLVLHEGCPTVVDGRRSSAHASNRSKRVVYSGRDIDLLRALWRHDTVHDIILSESALECLSLPKEHSLLSPESYVSSDQPLASMYSGVVVGGLDASAKVSVKRKGGPNSDGVTSTGSASNPLDLPPALKHQADSDRSPGSGSISTSSEHSDSGGTGGADDDLSHLVAPTNISKEELEALTQLGVDVLQKFLRVFTFDDQVNIVTGIAKRLHVQTPRIPQMKTSVKRSFNVLRNSLKQICNQLLLSMEGRELQGWLKTVAQYMDQRSIADSHRD